MDLFRLEIQLGNEAMRTEGDIARALESVARQVRGSGVPDHINAGMVRDINGNTVGGWDIGPQSSEVAQA